MRLDGLDRDDLHVRKEIPETHGKQAGGGEKRRASRAKSQNGETQSHRNNCRTDDSVFPFPIEKLARMRSRKHQGDSVNDEKPRRV